MDQTRIGIIGASGRGAVARYWHDPKNGSEVVAAADVDQSALDDLKETYYNRSIPNADLYLDYRELLERKDIDTIAVMSPDWTHEKYVCEAFDAGKNVFTEKPMAITVEGCDNMLRAWVKSGKKFMVGFNMRYLAGFRVMKDAIDSGMIGEPKVVWVRHFVSKGGEWYYHDWHANRKNSTGLLLQKASHDLDMIHWLTGKYAVRTAAFGGLDYYGGDRPDDLICPDCSEKDTCPEFQAPEKNGHPMNQCVFRKEVDVEDNNAVMMQLDGGIKATYMQCHFTATSRRNYTVIGTEGCIEAPGLERKVIVHLRSRSKRWKNLGKTHEIDISSVEGGHGGADPAMSEDFLDMLLKDKAPVSTPLAGRMSVAAGCAATESLRNGWQPVSVPPLPDDLQGKVY